MVETLASSFIYKEGLGRPIEYTKHKQLKQFLIPLPSLTRPSYL